MEWLSRHPAARVFTLANLALLLAAFVVGCAQTSPFVGVGDGGSKQLVRSFATWDSCLHRHGVAVPAGFNPYSYKGPKVPMSLSAERACEGLLPPPPPPTPSMMRKYVAEGSCLRRHGMDNVVSASGAITFANGVGPGTPGFNQALKACGLPPYS